MIDGEILKKNARKTTIYFGDMPLSLFGLKRVCFKIVCSNDSPKVLPAFLTCSDNAGLYETSVPIMIYVTTKAFVKDQSW